MNASRSSELGKKNVLLKEELENEHRLKDVAISKALNLMVKVAHYSFRLIESEVATTQSLEDDTLILCNLDSFNYLIS